MPAGLSADPSPDGSGALAMIRLTPCYKVFNHGIWRKNFVTGLQILDGIERPLKLYCDNKSTIIFFINNKSLTKSKYIDNKFLIAKGRVQSG